MSQNLLVNSENDLAVFYVPFFVHMHTQLINAWPLLFFQCQQYAKGLYEEKLFTYRQAAYFLHLSEFITNISNNGKIIKLYNLLSHMH